MVSQLLDHIGAVPQGVVSLNPLSLFHTNLFRQIKCWEFNRFLDRTICLFTRAPITKVLGNGRRLFVTSVNCDFLTTFHTTSTHTKTNVPRWVKGYDCAIQYFTGTARSTPSLNALLYVTRGFPTKNAIYALRAKSFTIT